MSQGKQIYYHNLRENIKNMHPRFKELAVQAGAYEDNGTILTGPMDVVKFAELIVRECVKVCGSRVGNSDYNTGRMHCASDLREHFGVEE